MLFTTTIPIYLNRESDVAKIRPSKVFARFFHDLTGGALSKEEERQTFTAVEILQDFHKTFRKMHITNLKRLSVDEFDYYKESNEQEDDLENAFAKMKLERADIEVPVFKHMYLSVKTQYSGLTLFLEVDIHRCHTPEEAPITLNITGTISEFRQQDGESEAQIKQRVHNAFASSDEFSDAKKGYEESFEAFTANLLMELKQTLRIKESEYKRQTVVIRPTDENKREFTGTGRFAYQSHYRDSSMDFVYLWFFMGMMQSNHIHASDMAIHSDQGAALAEIGLEDGLDANEAPLFDPSVDLSEVTLDSKYQPTAIGTSSTEDDFISFTNFSDGSTADTSSFDSTSCSSCGSSCGSGCGS